jgi:hypothetical protein
MQQSVAIVVLERLQAAGSFEIAARFQVTVSVVSVAIVS